MDGETQDGQRPLPPRDHEDRRLAGLAAETLPLDDHGTVHHAEAETPRTLRVLRHHRQLRLPDPIPACRAGALAQVARPAQPVRLPRLAAVRGVSGTLPAAPRTGRSLRVP